MLYYKTEKFKIGCCGDAYLQPISFSLSLNAPKADVFRAKRRSEKGGDVALKRWCCGGVALYNHSVVTRLVFNEYYKEMSTVKPRSYIIEGGG